MQDHAGRGESGGGGGGGGRVADRQRLLDPLVSLAALPGEFPEPLQRGDRPPGGLDVAGGDAVGQRGPQIRLLCGQPAEPGPLVAGAQLLVGSLGQRKVVGSVLPPGGGLGAGDRQPVSGVRPDGLQQAVAAGGAPGGRYQRLVHQPRQQCHHRCAVRIIRPVHRSDSLIVEIGGEHPEPVE